MSENLLITFVLVGPAVPENVGAAARAMKTMGIGQMRLVNPCDYLGTKSRMLAHASNELLEAAHLYESLEDAVADIDFVIGTTARKRTRRVDYHPIENLPEIIQSKLAGIASVAVVFGREETGLTNSELACCHLLSSISMKTAYPSLNLGQAVMLYAYTLSALAGKKLPPKRVRKNQQAWSAMNHKAASVLPQLGLVPDDLIYTRMMERIALLGDTDVNLVHSLLAAIEHKLTE